MTNTITYATSGSAVFTEDFSIDLYAGALGSETRWLDGAAGAADDYPGKLDGFQATNDDTTNESGRGLKLVCGRVTTVMVDDETITLSGGATKIHTVIVGDTSTAASSLALKAAPVAGVAQFTVIGTQWAGVTMWMIVS
jgi:hypothetical protein|tara:strand:+ start:1957 stop:2373 length:417 start_codon:yes stop_codon:yes gene_type:complete